LKGTKNMWLEFDGQDGDWSCSIGHDDYSEAIIGYGTTKRAAHKDVMRRRNKRSKCDMCPRPPSNGRRPKVRMTTQLDPEVLNWLAWKAQEEGLSRTEVIEKLVRRASRREPGGPTVHYPIRRIRSEKQLAALRERAKMASGDGRTAPESTNGGLDG